MADSAHQPEYITHLKCVLTEDEFLNLQALVNLGVPVASLARNKRWRPGHGSEFIFTGWKGAEAKLSHLRRHEPGRALIAKTGFKTDVIDVDIKGDSNGLETFSEIQHLAPSRLAKVLTPSGGFHEYVPATGMSCVRFGGIDYQALGQMVFLPGTLRPKYDDQPYTWLQPFRWRGEPADDRFPLALQEMKGGMRSTAPRVSKTPRKSLYGGDGTLAWAYQRVSRAPKGQRNDLLYRTAVHLAATAETGFDADMTIVQTLTEASVANGYLDEHGMTDALTTIRNGIQDGRTMQQAGN